MKRTRFDEQEVERLAEKNKENLPGLAQYLEETKKYDAMIDKEREEYKDAVVSLALMMDKDPKSFSDDDMQEALTYLFPSSLLSPTARPKLLPPEKVHPARKSLQCSLDGRPLHSLFYTTMPNYYSILREATQLLHKLDRQEDKDIREGIKTVLTDTTEKLNLEDSEWISVRELESLTLEKVTDYDLKGLINLLERLANHDNGKMAEDFIMKFRNKRVVQSKELDLPQFSTDEETGRQFVEAYGQKKRAFAEVRIWKNGTGKISVNEDRFLHVFPDIGDREQVLHPLSFAGLLGSVDVILQVEGSGSASRSAAGRLAIARAISCFVDTTMKEKMRLAGLLVNDMRFNEKKKGGLHKARKQFIWKRR